MSNKMRKHIIENKCILRMLETALFDIKMIENV